MRRTFSRPVALALMSVQPMLRKVRAQLDSGTGRAAAQLAVLVLPGAFAPIHREHIAALAVARDAVEAERWCQPALLKWLA